MIMRFRPANIRLINRRSICPGCCSLCPREKGKGNYKNIPTDFAELTRSLHIRAMRELSGMAIWYQLRSRNADFRMPAIRKFSYDRRDYRYLSLAYAHSSMPL